MSKHRGRLFKFESIANVSSGKGAARLRFITIAQNMAQVETNVRKRMRLYAPGRRYVIKRITNLGIYERGDDILRKDNTPVDKSSRRGHYIPHLRRYVTINDIPGDQIMEKRIRGNSGRISIVRIWQVGRSGGPPHYDITNPREFKLLS